MAVESPECFQKYTLQLLQEQYTRRTLQEGEQRMHELSYFIGVFYACGLLSEPVAYRSLSTNSDEFQRIHSISVRTPCPPAPSSGFPALDMLFYRVILPTSSSPKPRRTCHPGCTLT